MAVISTDLALLRLLHLCSANLPVGAYAFSQGLECAVELGWVKDEDSLADWITLQLEHGLAHVDLPLLMRMEQALAAQDEEALRYWNQLTLACRESHELRLGDLATGAALQRLLPTLGVPLISDIPECSYLGAYAQAAHFWQIPQTQSLQGFLWAWIENQVIAATKLMPLGQTRAHHLLATLQEHIPALLSIAANCEDEDIGSSLPGVAIASSQHETQYSRLFRS